MFKRRFALIGLILLANACASPQPQSMLERTAFELQLQCRAYYFMREPRLAYPDPEEICWQVYTLVVRGAPVGNWKL